MTLHRHRRDEHFECGRTRDVMTEWGWSRSYEAYTIGLMMSSEAQTAPFLIPSEEVVRFQLLRMRYAKALTGGSTKSSPTLVWAPLVTHAQRGVYEAMVSAQFGLAVTISDMAYDGTQAGAFALSTVPAAERREYFPATVAWSVLDDALGDSENVARGVGGDTNTIFMDDDVVFNRLIKERRIVLHARVVCC